MGGSMIKRSALEKRVEEHEAKLLEHDAQFEVFAKRLLEIEKLLLKGKMIEKSALNITDLKADSGIIVGQSDSVDGANTSAPRWEMGIGGKVEIISAVGQCSKTSGRGKATGKCVLCTKYHQKCVVGVCPWNPFFRESVESKIELGRIKSMFGRLKPVHDKLLVLESFSEKKIYLDGIRWESLKWEENPDEGPFFFFKLLQARNADLEARIGVLEARNSDLEDAKKRELEAAAAELAAARAVKLDAREEALDARTVELNAREAELAERSAELNARAPQVDAKAEDDKKTNV